MKKFITICTAASLFLLGGCSKAPKPEEFAKDVVMLAQDMPTLTESEDAVTDYEAWLKEAVEKFKEQCSETGTTRLETDAFPALNVIMAEHEMPAEITNTKVEEKAGNSYYITFTLKDKNAAEFEVKLRMQYTDKKVSFINVITGSN